MRNYLISLKNFQFPLIGVGITAFSRCGPGLFLDNYSLLCYKDSRDNEVINKKTRVFSLEKDFLQPGEKTGPLNTLAILKNKQVQKYLNSLGKKPYLVLYRSTRGVEKLCLQMGWRMVANQVGLRNLYENKDSFRKVLKKIGIEAIPGEEIKLKEFSQARFNRFLKKWQKTVLILPQLTKGGGHSLVFASQPADFNILQEKIKKWRGKFNLKTIIVSKFIKGYSPSITGCVTRHGTLTGIVQTQVLDQPNLVSLDKGGGLFCGHDWSYKTYYSSTQKQAERIARAVGKHMWQKGYRGIFGVDLLVEEKTGKVYPCECNPRYTGAFPVYSMLQAEAGEPPFDIFHLLELLELDYDLDFQKIEQQYKTPKQGSHLVMTNLEEKYMRVNGDLKAGVYSAERQKLKYQRPGFTTADLRETKEFLLTDGIFKKGQIVKPLLRMGKLVFKKGVLKENGKELKDEIREIIRLIYKEMGLKPK